jgi:hypothetical protein
MLNFLFDVRVSVGVCSNRSPKPAARIYRRNSLFPTLVVLLAAAVVCIALSLADDDIQYASFHKKPRCSRLVSGGPCKTTPRGIRRIQAAVLMASLPAPRRELAATILVVESNVYVELFPSASGERSPPVC